MSIGLAVGRAPAWLAALALAVLLAGPTSIPAAAIDPGAPQAGEEGGGSLPGAEEPAEGEDPAEEGGGGAACPAGDAPLELLV